MDGTLKRTTLISAAAGAIFALVLIAAGVLWYSTRQHQPRPWNTRALRAEFHYVDTEGQQNTLVFGYYLENQSDTDYQLPDANEILLMMKRADNGALSQPQTDDESFDQKVFFPAHQKVNFRIHINVAPDIKKKGSYDKSDNGKQYEEALKAWVSKHFGGLGGWVLLDKQNRYQIIFPKGW